MIGACYNLFDAGAFEVLYLCRSSCYHPQVLLLAPGNQRKQFIFVLRTDCPTLNVLKKHSSVSYYPLPFFSDYDGAFCCFLFQKLISRYRK